MSEYENKKPNEEFCSDLPFVLKGKVILTSLKGCIYELRKEESKKNNKTKTIYNKKKIENKTRKIANTMTNPSGIKITLKDIRDVLGDIEEKTREIKSTSYNQKSVNIIKRTPFDNEKSETKNNYLGQLYLISNKKNYTYIQFD